MRKYLFFFLMVSIVFNVYAFVDDPCPPYSPGVNTGAYPTGPSDTGPYVDKIGNTVEYYQAKRQPSYRGD